MKINNEDEKLIKMKLNLFFSQCEDNLYISLLRNFFKFGGIELFNKYFYDDENLIYKIIKNCDLNCISSINLSLINNNFILIDKKFFSLFKLSLKLSHSEKNIFWNLVFSQRRIPSIQLKEFLIYSLEILKKPPVISEINKIQIDYEEFFDKVINSLLILFKNEINNENSTERLEKISEKIIYMFEFGKDENTKEYMCPMIDIFLKNYFKDKDEQQKIFSIMIKIYYNKIGEIEEKKKYRNLLNEFIKYEKNKVNNEEQINYSNAINEFITNLPKSNK
jgi:hypothetical protein